MKIPRSSVLLIATGVLVTALTVQARSSPRDAREDAQIAAFGEIFKKPNAEAKATVAWEEYRDNPQTRWLYDQLPDEFTDDENPVARDWAVKAKKRMADDARATRQHPSFDCVMAKTATEKIICGDAALAKADREMAQRYEKELSFLLEKDRASLRHAQKEWLMQREMCTDRDCLEILYAGRLTTFNTLNDSIIRTLCQDRELCDTVRVSTAGFDAQGNSLEIVHLCAMDKGFADWNRHHQAMVKSDCGLSGNEEYWLIVKSKGSLQSKQFLIEGTLIDPDQLPEELIDPEIVSHIEIQNNTMTLTERKDPMSMGDQGFGRLTKLQLSPLKMINAKTEVFFGSAADFREEAKERVKKENERWNPSKQLNFKPDEPIFKCQDFSLCERNEDILPPK